MENVVLETAASFLVILAFIILKQGSSLYTYKEMLKSVWAQSDDISETGAWAVSDLSPPQAQFQVGPGISSVSVK